MFASAMGCFVSPGAVLYVLQTPAARPAFVVGSAPIAELSAVSAVARLPAFGFECSSARYSSTLPFSPRLKRRNAAGVLKLPLSVKPGGSVKGNAVPPAARSVAALSSDEEMDASAFGLQTTAAGGSSIAWLTSIAMPSESRSSNARYSESALNVRTNPRVPDTPLVDRPVALGSAFRTVVPARTAKRNCEKAARPRNRDQAAMHPRASVRRRCSAL